MAEFCCSELILEPRVVWGAEQASSSPGLLLPVLAGSAIQHSGQKQWRSKHHCQHAVGVLIGC